MLRGTLGALVAAISLALALPASAETKSGFAPVNGLEMYYEVQGDGPPLVLLHGALMFRLLGGGVPGDLEGLPRSRLAVLPGTTHVTLVDRAGWLAPMVAEFLDAPMPDPK